MLRQCRAGFIPSGAPVQTKMWGPLIYEYPPLDCLHPTRTVVIIDILLKTRAALLPNHYFSISGLLLCCKKMKKLTFCGGPLFVGAPVRPNMLNMPKSASAPIHCVLWQKLTKTLPNVAKIMPNTTHLFVCRDKLRTALKHPGDNDDISGTLNVTGAGAH